MSKQASATISRASESQSNPKSFDLAAYLQSRGAIAAVIPAADNIRTPDQIIKELFALPAPDIRDLYIRAFGDNKPVELTSGASAEDFQFIIRAAYKQVFGNAHLMASERSPEAESQFRSGRISVMEFIRQLAKSDRYRTLFFDRCPNVRFIELNFKHLLGRAPENAAEISEHIKIIAEGGFEAEIDSYLDSDEYFQSFGTIIVPYHRIFATQTDNGLVGFTHLFKLLQGACSSDKSNSISFSPTLQKSLFGNTASKVNWLSTVPKTAPSVSPFEATKGEFVLPEPETTPESVAEPSTLTIEETQDKEAAAFTAWRGQFNELLKEEFVADNAVEMRVREAGKDVTAGRRFNPQGFDLATYLQVEEAANQKPITVAATGAEVASKYTNAFRDRDVVEFAQNNSVEDLDLVVEAAYKQVFGNAYIMESERVSEAESQLRSGRISVMEFVRQLAKSDHYRTIFFERCTNLRAIELNFKHLLGRAPANAAEISEHIQLIANGGFEAEIDSYIDSDEYF
ncbi:MAG: phycobilisome rod-core linker polypeptide, partial [Cyanobacteria bacterium J06638_38]